MFDVGFWELVLVALVALLVFGPDRLPGLIREVSLWVRKVRAIVSSAKSDIDRELQLHEIKQTLEEKRRRIEKELTESAGGPVLLTAEQSIRNTNTDTVPGSSENDGR